MEIKDDKGNKTVFLKINRIDEDTRKGIRQGFFRLGSALRKTASQQILSKNKTGRIYRIRRGKTIRNHQASAPGESPANLSGNYRKNIGFEIKGSDEMEFGGRAEYSGYLEEGTRHGKGSNAMVTGLQKMAPRPGLGNAVKAEEKNAIVAFESSIESNLK